MSGQPVLLDLDGFLPLYELPNAQRLVPEIIGMFLREADNLLGEAFLGVADGDLTRVDRAAHGLRGSSSFVGAARLKVDAEALELAAEHGLVAEVVPRLERVVETLRQTRPLLLAALENPPLS